MDFLPNNYKILKLSWAKQNVFDDKIEFIYAFHSIFLSSKFLNQHKWKTNNLRTFYKMFAIYCFHTRDCFYIEVRIQPFKVFISLSLENTSSQLCYFYAGSHAIQEKFSNQGCFKVFKSFVFQHYVLVLCCSFLWFSEGKIVCEGNHLSFRMWNQITLYLRCDHYNILESISS